MSIRRMAIVVGSVVVAASGLSPLDAEAAAPAGDRIIGDGVVAVDPDGSNQRRLVEGGHSADQTADGSRLVFVRGDQLYTATGDGGDEQPIGGSVTGREPRWSPDATRIAYTAGTSEAPSIAVVNADGSGATTVAAGSSPDWSPDGEQLAYVANERIWITAARPGAPAVALTDSLPFVTRPRWSPDGTVIGFGGWCVGVVHPDGSGQRCLTNFGPPASAARYFFSGWAPDSRNYASYWTGFHQWSGTSWTNPATGERVSAGSTFFATDWAGPSGTSPCGSGYWLLGRDGGVFTFGSATFHGSTGGMRLNQPVVGMARSGSGNGYWFVAGDGGVFSFGDAPFHGSTGALRLKAPIVGMASTPTGNGYWLVASDGGIFSFGDADFFGSTGAMNLNAPIVGMSRTSSGRGYWLVASDGGMFTFGDAAFFGSAGDLDLAAPVVGMAPSVTGSGYTLAARDGGTFAFGDARYPGSLVIPGADRPPVTTAVGVGGGLLLATSTGEVAALDEARFCGSVKHLRLAAPIIGAAVA